MNQLLSQRIGFEQLQLSLNNRLVELQDKFRLLLMTGEQKSEITIAYEKQWQQSRLEHPPQYMGWSESQPIRFQDRATPKRIDSEDIFKLEIASLARNWLAMASNSAWPIDKVKPGNL